MLYLCILILIFYLIFINFLPVCKQNKVDHDYLTLEMVISKPFDQVIKSQLEPVWNQLGSKPKQLINDIKTLRLLL